jgi:hypothetical protein
MSDRWPKVTSESSKDVKLALLELIRRTGKNLPGGVDADLVEGAHTVDLLDCAQAVVDDTSYWSGDAADQDGLRKHLRALLDLCR